MQRSANTDESASRMTLEEWADLDEDVEGELVDGVLTEEEMPSFLHEIIVAWLIRTLGAWAERRRGQVAASEAKVVVGRRRGRKPDLSVYLPNRMPALADSLVRVPPHLVVEVVSPRPRDARRDRVDKRRDYARAGIPYYWIVDPQLHRLDVFALGTSGRYRVALTAAGGGVRVPGCPGLALDLDALWRAVAQAEQAHERSRPSRRRGR
jgi:Uma2 family endonuclease